MAHGQFKPKANYENRKPKEGQRVARRDNRSAQKVALKYFTC